MENTIKVSDALTAIIEMLKANNVDDAITALDEIRDIFKVVDNELAKGKIDPFLIGGKKS